jgi:hypothetical protein
MRRRSDRFPNQHTTVLRTVIAAIHGSHSKSTTSRDSHHLASQGAKFDSFTWDPSISQRKKRKEKRKEKKIPSPPITKITQQKLRSSQFQRIERSPPRPQTTCLDPIPLSPRKTRVNYIRLNRINPANHARRRGARLPSKKRDPKEWTTPVTRTA